MTKSTEKSEFPAWFYGPEGQSAIFETESEVPSGWKDHPSAFAEQKDEEPEGRQPEDAVNSDGIYAAMGMAELRSALDGKGISYHPSAKREKLISLLRTATADKTQAEN
jgi:hypothetical protein